MPHVTGHFCVCHVELWLLFHDFFPCTQCTVYLGTWVPGYLGAWVPGAARRTHGSAWPDSGSGQPDSGVRLAGLRGPSFSPAKRVRPFWSHSTVVAAQKKHRMVFFKRKKLRESPRCVDWDFK